MSTVNLTGILISRDHHAGDQNDEPFSGTREEVEAAVVAASVPTCGCCGGCFQSDCGLQCSTWGDGSTTWKHIGEQFPFKTVNFPDGTTY